jgi:hypothetical protein
VIEKPDFKEIEANAGKIVTGIREESVAVFAFLLDEFARGSVDKNLVFQFAYRSFYALNNAGLTPDFTLEYFRIMEQHRGISDIALEQVVTQLYSSPGRRGYKGLQFSFATKMANMINPNYPIYDSEVAGIFGFRPPYTTWSLEKRLAAYMTFYTKMQNTYKQIVNGNLMDQSRRLFRERYSQYTQKIPEVKVVDFIFWSAGKATRRRILEAKGQRK